MVVDREVRLVAEARRLPAENPSTRGVEGHHPHRPGNAADHPFEPPLHLACGLVREGDREDLVRLRPCRLQEMDDAVGEYASLPGARGRDHENRAFGRCGRRPVARDSALQGTARARRRPRFHDSPFAQSPGPIVPALVQRGDLLAAESPGKPARRVGERSFVGRLEHDLDLGPVLEEARVAADLDGGMEPRGLLEDADDLSFACPIAAAPRGDWSP